MNIKKYKSDSPNIKYLKNVENTLKSRIYTYNNLIRNPRHIDYDIFYNIYPRVRRSKKTKRADIKSRWLAHRMLINLLRGARNKKNKIKKKKTTKFISEQKRLLNKKKRRFFQRLFIKNRSKFFRYFRVFKKMANKRLQRLKYQALIKSQKKPIIKAVLPWIIEGRKQQKELEYQLILWLFHLKRSYNTRDICVIKPEYQGLIKQYRKKFKFSKFGRYGIHAPARWKQKKNFVKFIKPMPPMPNKVKRQQVYLQAQRLFMVNHSYHSFFYTYIYMLIIIWYILNNGFLMQEKKIFAREMWFNYFLKHAWIPQACYSNNLANNWYLSYGAINSLQSRSCLITLYTPTMNMLNYYLKPLKNYDRLFKGVLNRVKPVNSRIKKSFKPRNKRKNKVRGFFRISPKLRYGNKIISRFFNKKNKKKSKNKKRLSPKEWLLMSQFTRRKYQHKFSAVFSQWKNVKQLYKYINKPSQMWHQPYIITHPYYYTSRYNTFVYQMAQE